MRSAPKLGRAHRSCFFFFGFVFSIFVFNYAIVPNIGMISPSWFWNPESRPGASRIPIVRTVIPMPAISSLGDVRVGASQNHAECQDTFRHSWEPCFLSSFSFISKRKYHTLYITMDVILSTPCMNVSWGVGFLRLSWTPRYPLRLASLALLLLCRWTCDWQVYEGIGWKAYL